MLRGFMSTEWFLPLGEPFTTKSVDKEWRSTHRHPDLEVGRCAGCTVHTPSSSTLYLYLSVNLYCFWKGFK